MKKTTWNPRKKRKIRIRKKISGTRKCPRMSVFRSCKHIYVQIVDDDSGMVLASASSISKESGDKTSMGSGLNAARTVGGLIAERALAKNIEQVVFDRNGYLYHGRVRSLADAAREKGLKF